MGILQIPGTREYTQRTYRHRMGHRFVHRSLSCMETDLWIGLDPAKAPTAGTEASYRLDREMLDIVETLRKDILDYATEVSSGGLDFLRSLVPLPMDYAAPFGVRKMLQGGIRGGVGPMASVAGIVAETLGNWLVENRGFREVIVENGGDIFLRLQNTAVVEILGGPSELSGIFGVVVPPEMTPLGICTSSGTHGHSFSFGRADGVCIVAKDTALADALATSYGNRVQSQEDIEGLLEEIRQDREIIFAMIIMGSRAGMIGDLDIKRL